MKPTAAHFRHPRNMSSIPADSSAGSRRAQLAKVRYSDGLGVWRASNSSAGASTEASRFLGVVGFEGTAIYCFSMPKSAALGNALTVIWRFVNARPYDQEILYFRFCSRTCQRLRCASAIANPGRVARWSTGKTSHAQESSNDGVTRRNRCIFFACCCTGVFTNSQARSQKS